MAPYGDFEKLRFKHLMNETILFETDKDGYLYHFDW